MGILSDFFIAEDKSTPQYDPGPGFPAEDRYQLKGITPLQAAGILTVLRGRGNPVELISEFHLLTPEDAEEWIVSVPHDMSDFLRDLNTDGLIDAARQCAEVTKEELGWSPREFEDLLRRLRELSRHAHQDGKRMFLWNSL